MLGESVIKILLWIAFSLQIEDVADESVNAKKAETEVKAVIASQKQNGTTTIGFGETSDSSSAATIATKKANDISNLVRKRKPEVQPAEGSKKVKLESTPTAEGDKENGVSSTDECSKISSWILILCYELCILLFTVVDNSFHCAKVSLLHFFVIFYHNIHIVVLTESYWITCK